MGRGREAILMQCIFFSHNTQRDKNNKNHSKPTKNKLHNLNGLFEGQKRFGGNDNFDGLKYDWTYD